MPAAKSGSTKPRRVSFKQRHGRKLREQIRQLKKQLAVYNRDYRSLYPKRKTLGGK